MKAVTGVEMTTSIEKLKTEARRLRESLTQSGAPVSHSQSLELIAKQKGYRDWNTIHAAIGNRHEGPPVEIGQKIEGAYLGQSFSAEVLGIQSMNHSGRWRITLDLEEPVDVVTFDSFSAFRRRISATIGQDGKTAERTSNGQPQLVLNLP